MRLIGTAAKWLDDRLQLGAPIRDTMAHPIPKDTASWFYVFGSAAMTVFAFQLVTGNLARASLCAIRRGSLEQLANSEPSNNPRMVHSCPAWLGLKFYAGHCADPHGPGVSLWRL